jgi:hypothetical protein
MAGRKNKNPSVRFRLNSQAGRPPSRKFGKDKPEEKANPARRKTKHKPEED